MKKKSESHILGKLLKKIAPRIGAKVFLEPEWNIAGQIIFKSGKKSYFRYNTIDLNPVGSSEIAKDKDYANLFMKRQGYPIVPGSKTFFSREWADAIGSPERDIDSAYEHACRLGFPVIVKPNSGSQGAGVSLVSNKTDFYKTMKSIFKRHNVALVQQAVSGKDYRIVVLDDTIISAYERIPLSVVGDGALTILQLLDAKQKNFKKIGRDINLKTQDPRIHIKLKRQGLTLQSIIPKGQRVELLDNANLSTGGDSIDMTTQVHPEFAQIAINLTRDMGLRLCGVDLMIDGDISKPPHQYWVLEINAAPGLDHYAKSGTEQKHIVENLYLKVLESLDRA